MSQASPVGQNTVHPSWGRLTVPAVEKSKMYNLVCTFAEQRLRVASPSIHKTRAANAGGKPREHQYFPALDYSVLLCSTSPPPFALAREMDTTAGTPQVKNCWYLFGSALWSLLLLGCGVNPVQFQFSRALPSPRKAFFLAALPSTRTCTLGVSQQAYTVPH